MNQIDKLLWIEDFLVQASDTDFRLKAKLSFILDVMQRAADSAVHNLGLSMDKMLEAGMGWMVITMDLDINRLPLPNEVLTVHTWSKGNKGALWQRDYRIFDQNKLEIASARSMWALVDIDKRKILRPSALPVAVEPYLEDSVGPIPQKVAIPADVILQEAYRYQVRYSGLDNNGHLNNARYVDICCDALTLEEWNELKLTGLQITYAQEAKYGTDISILRSEWIEDGIYIRGQDADRVLFEAHLKLEKSAL
ncbi:MULTISPECIES: acyl-ACP thioesterase domain-containing protein [unclassified Paenibacillus]|uniref:acyl-[acyl-carrier-protein] thioesterase n=1 Tax=unclassified Paenibacillus TaxID=185978 RepID=UPI002406E917|nr:MULTISPECIES: acyl-ACP thioesterase domain-containing protein [unclassified Paenibacillus]MDF9844641.1 medium-chain acyl-[acyl-carrier-protein] hydrolase [Paenibacillus sp. PastF-2]MDF9851183.1 medium-chain acyl-[acyl-carrier-protein] hydrolase [Paenibacillus sp. PastM-2]MDF9857826.1 medium-chain acyl-[acyl-carrier-protein] hydrolase [Paenibacillus sp. PastF-1]MDH6483032.1 medium-chain acyl-[acyl-carrier-protein] hydrolase [Paenibacillus sp. PastH-2]MDH6510504.1 medium-chain acyl-[acyl-carr